MAATIITKASKPPSKPMPKLRSQGRKPEGGVAARAGGAADLVPRASAVPPVGPSARLLPAGSLGCSATHDVG